MTNTQASPSIQLPNPKFQSALARWEGRLSECASLWEGYALDEPVLESTPLKDVEWATLFAYMHRRFGPPHIGGDDYKDLSAGWALTTPDEYVFVIVSPSLSGPGFSFTPYYLRAIEEKRPTYALKLPPSRVEEVKSAYKATLLDLLRPVGVRDSVINAMGELGESELDQALQECGEDGEEENLYEVKRHDSCGYSMPVGLFGGQDWATLCAIIQGLGNGDIKKGRAAVIASLQRSAYAEAANASLQVKRLMLMANFNQIEEVAKGLNLSASEVEMFTSEIRSLAGPCNQVSELISELSIEDVDVAVGFLMRLGFGGNGLKKRVLNLQNDVAVDEVFRELQAICGDEFPEEALPQDYPTSSGDYEAGFRKSFEALNRMDMLKWLDSTLARTSGRSALAHIAHYLHSMAAAAKDPHAMMWVAK